MKLYEKIVLLIMLTLWIGNMNIYEVEAKDRKTTRERKKPNYKYSEFVKQDLAIPTGKGRILLYKDEDFLDIWGAPIRLNGQKICTINQGKFYYMDVMPGLYSVNLGTGFIESADVSLFLPEGEMLFVNIYYRDRGNGVLSAKIVDRDDVEKKIKKFKYQPQKTYDYPVPREIWMEDEITVINNKDKYYRKEQSFFIRGYADLKSNTIMVSQIIDLRKNKTLPFEGFLMEYDFGDNGIKFLGGMRSVLENKNYFCKLSGIDVNESGETEIDNIVQEIVAENKSNSQWLLLLGVTGFRESKYGKYNNVDLISILIDAKTRDVLLVNYAYLDMENIRKAFNKENTGPVGGIIPVVFDSFKNAVNFASIKHSLFISNLIQHIPDNDVIEID
jgi:hypothetical protein